MDDWKKKTKKNSTAKLEKKAYGEVRSYVRLRAKWSACEEKALPLGHCDVSQQTDLGRLLAANWFGTDTQCDYRAHPESRPLSPGYAIFDTRCVQNYSFCLEDARCREEAM